MLDIQNDEKKASIELLHHKICDPRYCTIHMEKSPECIEHRGIK